jgi:hydrogenase maturation factor
LSCDDGHCVTCADEALPLRVVEARAGGLALCEEDVEVMTDLVGTVEAGDVLLVHAGAAIARVES